MRGVADRVFDHPSREHVVVSTTLDILFLGCALSAPSDCRLEYQQIGLTYGRTTELHISVRFSGAHPQRCGPL